MDEAWLIISPACHCQIEKMLITLEPHGIFGSKFEYLFIFNIVQPLECKNGKHHFGQSMSFSENAHNSWTIWYIWIKVCILIYFNIVQPLERKNGKHHFGRSMSFSENAHKSWYILINFCILIHFNTFWTMVHVYGDDALPYQSVRSWSVSTNAHNFWTTWYILIRFCLLIHFNIVWPLVCKTGTTLCRKIRPPHLPLPQLPPPPKIYVHHGSCNLRSVDCHFSYLSFKTCILYAKTNRRIEAVLLCTHDRCFILRPDSVWWCYKSDTKIALFSLFCSPWVGDSFNLMRGRTGYQVHSPNVLVCWFFYKINF